MVVIIHCGSRDVMGFVLFRMHCPLLRRELSPWEKVLWIYGAWVGPVLCK